MPQPLQVKEPKWTKCALFPTLTGLIALMNILFTHSLTAFFSLHVCRYRVSENRAKGHGSRFYWSIRGELSLRMQSPPAL